MLIASDLGASCVDLGQAVLIASDLGASCVDSK